MKYKSIDIEKIIIIVLMIILISLVIIFTVRNRSQTGAFTRGNINAVNINKIISNTKSQYANLKLDYESKNIKEFTSLVYKNDVTEKNMSALFTSVIIDTKTGRKMNFLDFIKPAHLADFSKKEMELLSLKYPEFIVKAIAENKTKEGFRFYYVKDNEVIIFYYNYEIPYNYEESLSLSLNYREIKAYLDFTPNLDKTYNNEDGYKYNSTKPTVALTFDDGPSSKYNNLILKELTKNKAHATFFMVGKMMESCGKCVADTYKSGNEVASHTYEHMNIKRNTYEDVNSSLNKVNDIYHKITKQNIKYLRPPYGAYSKENLENTKIPFILWNLDTEDWRYKDVDHIVNYIIENVSDGSIILMHELYETSYEALKVVLPRLYAMGYQVVSVSELANLKNKVLEPGNSYYKIL